MATDKSVLISDPSADKHDLYFRTDHLKTNLGGRTARGGAVAVTNQALKFFISLGATAVMARLLTPQDYGLIGMVAFVTGFVSTYKDLGLSAATIQRPEISSDQISTLFWVNVALSVGITILTILIAPLVSWFYGEPRLTSITIVTAFGFLISGVAVQHEALLRRQMRYFAIATTGLLSLIAGYIVGISMAWKGFSYWALVGSQLAVVTTSSAITWIVCRWKPGWPKKDTGVRSMIRFGGNLTGFATINFFARNLDNLLIGKFWGAQQLGLYSRAYQLMMLPIEQINEPITSVAVPSLSRLSDSPEDYRRAYLRMLEKIAFLTMPAVAVMIATSDWIVAIVLGPQWREVGKLLAILGVAALFQPIANTTGWLFVTQGRTNDMFKTAIFGGPISIASIIVGLPWGAVGVATSYTVSHILGIPVLYWYICRQGPIRASDFYRTIGPFVAGALSGLLGSLAFRHWQPSIKPVLGIAVCLVITGGTFLLVLILLPAGRRALRDVGTSLLLLGDKGDGPSH
jgi:O-antigen/teichoic acid export membrane protein